MKTFKMIDPNLIRLYRYFMPYKWRLGFACVFLMGSASMSSITATLLGKMADLGFYQQESWMIYAAPVALIAVTVGFAFCTVMSAYLMAQVSQSVLLTMRGLLFEHILHWPESEFQKHTSGRMSSKFVNEAASALSGAVGSFTVLVRDSVQVAALLVVLFWQDWKLTLVTFVIIPGLAVTLRFISTRIRKIVGESQELLGGMISRVQETYEAERLVKVSNAYDFEERRFADVNDGIRRLSLKSLKLSAVTTPVTQILTLVAIACVVGVALYQAQHGMLTIGEFVTFLSALLLIKAPIQHLSGLSGTFAGISVAAESIFETLDSPVEIEGTEELEIGPGEGRIEFEHVVVRYPGKDVPAVRDFSLTVRPGECIAVVGQSGSGKTTLINLLPRFLEPESGRVMIDGRDIRDFRLGSLRSRIAFVTQDVVIFDDTLRNNLTYGLENVTDEQIREALEACQRQGNEQVVLLKCCSQYPAQYEDMNVATIADMKERFGVPVGLSDHSMGSLADVVAVSLGAQVIEKHVCLDRTIDNPDAAFSMEIGEFAQMVQDVRNACVIKGKATYELTEHEKSSLKYRRSLVAVKPIAEGETFTEENVRSIRPAIGIKPKYYRTLLGRKAKKAYRFGEPILPGEVE